MRFPERKIHAVLLTLVLSLSVTACGAEPAPTATPTVAPENPALLMAPMPDGVRLASDVYRPAGDGPWPTILMRTPYSRQAGMDLLANAFTTSGYAVVVQDMRGRFDSEGVDHGFFDDAVDGQATLEWIAAQPWSDGRVATWGPSALGIAGYLLAPDAPEALRCQLSLIATPDVYTHAAFPGGVPRQALVQGWVEDLESEHLLDEWFGHELRDAYWDPVDISDRYGQVHVPALHVGGWYDIFAQGTLDAFVGYQEAGGTGAAGRQHLIMGPWTHMGLGQREQGALTYPANAALGQLGLLTQASEWFDHCLLGETTAAAGWPPVRYYLMGDVDDPDAPGNAWREAERWPPPSTAQALYLRAGGELSVTPPPTDESGDTFRYDPADPSPTVCGANLNLPAGPCEQREVEARADVVVYSTPPLEAPLEVTGPVRARVWLVADVPDTDVVVRLTDVYPDGRSMLVLDGALRARFRDGDFSRVAWMTPGTPYELEVDLGSTAIVFNAGHRVRIIISASNAPRFAPNPNTGPSDGTPQVATLTLLHDAKHPAALVLPGVGDGLDLPTVR